MAYRAAVCDDSAADADYVRGIVAHWAEQRGIALECRAFSSAEQFLFSYAEDKNFDLLLLDVEMPGADGVTLAKTVRQENEAVQIVFITGYSDYIAEGYDVAALHYLMKPVRPEKLCAVLDRAWEKHRRNERCLNLERYGEMIRLQTLREHLAKRVVGQQEAVEKIARTIRRSRAGLKDENRPIGVFLFVGPTGVGKTLLAKEVSKWLFDEHRGLIRIDMSEYGEKHNVARLIGSPPGYVGYGEGGQLTEAVRRQPYAVVLFDEIEKAHPDVFNILLQVLDDGRLTDNKGRTVDFRNTIIIMTSNMGSQVIQDNFAEAFDGRKLPEEVVERTRLAVIDLLKQQLKPEFLNRIDEIVMFEPLTHKDIERIVDIQLGIVRRMLSENGIRLEYSDKAREWIASAGYDPLYGARPVKRVIQRYVVNDLSKRILAGEVDRSKPIAIDAGQDGLTFSN